VRNPLGKSPTREIFVSVIARQHAQKRRFWRHTAAGMQLTHPHPGLTSERRKYIKLKKESAVGYLLEVTFSITPAKKHVLQRSKFAIVINKELSVEGNRIW
jgi:hypothetical protein